MTDNKGWWASQSAEVQMALAMGSLLLVAGVVAVGYELSKRGGTAKGATTRATEVQPTVTTEPDIPPKVTRAWCGRLAARLEPRFMAEAKTKYAGRDPAYVEGVVGDYIRNLTFNCTEDVGETTEGEWACQWNSNFDNHDACEKLRRRR